MARIPRKTNYAKLVYEAERTKSKVKKNQIDAYQKWQQKLGKKAQGLDALDDRLRKINDAVELAEKSDGDKKQAIQRLGKMIEGAFKELETYKSVPVPGKLPDYPKNLTSLGSMAIVLAPMIAYLAAVKAYMAMSEVLSKKDT